MTEAACFHRANPHTAYLRRPNGRQGTFQGGIEMAYKAAGRRSSSGVNILGRALVLAFSLTSAVGMAQVSEPSAQTHRVKLKLDENPIAIKGVVRAPAVVFLDARESVTTEVDLTTNSTFVNEVVKSTEQAPFQMSQASAR